jgi:redox-sensitive bicupin YhaK (pirin superfamily)
MSSERRIARIVTVPPPMPGFVGPGHLAAQVVSPEDFVHNDPFIALMDDHLDIGDRSVGGPHPHAGFETVTLILDGSIYDRDEGGTLNAGEVQWMTAGRGIIHGENVAANGKVRLLQLWLVLPPSERWTTPAFQDLHADAIPIRHADGVDVRIYSGRSGDVRSGTVNHVPVTIVEMTMAATAVIDQEIPASYTGFVYVIDGAVRIGEDAAVVKAGQVGWLDSSDSDAGDRLRITALADGARLVIYAGEPQRAPIVSYGPFIGDSESDIHRLFAEYRAGQFERMSELVRAKRGRVPAG